MTKTIINTTDILVVFLVVITCIGILVYQNYWRNSTEQFTSPKCGEGKATVIKNLAIPNFYDKGSNTSVSPETKQRYTKAMEAIGTFKKDVKYLDSLSCDTYWTYMDAYAKGNGFLEKDGANKYTITPQGKFEALQMYCLITATYVRMLAGSAAKPSPAVQSRILNWMNDIFNMISGVYIARYGNTYSIVEKRNKLHKNNNQLIWYAASAIMGVYINGAMSPLDNQSRVPEEKVTGPSKVVAANIAKLVAQHVKDNFIIEPSTKATVILGNGQKKEVNIAFITCEGDRDHKTLAYHNYYTNILFSCLTVIKETKVPFDWEGTRAKVESLVNNLTLPGNLGRFENKYKRKDFLQYLNNTGLSTKTELEGKFNNTVNNFRPMFEYLYNNKEVPSATMTGYLLNARVFVQSLRTINKPMGSFPIPVVAPLMDKVPAKVLVPAKVMPAKVVPAKVMPAKVVPAKVPVKEEKAFDINAQLMSLLNRFPFLFA